MAITKSFLLKSVEIDIEHGNINLKWLKRLVDSEEGVLYESPVRRAVAKDDIDALNEAVPDVNLRNDIKKLAKWTK